MDKPLNFIGEPREGGYLYITSAELPGFTLMLPPQDWEVETLIAAIRPALEAYLAAKRKQLSAAKKRAVFTNANIKHRDSVNLVAELAAA